MPVSKKNPDDVPDDPDLTMMILTTNIAIRDRIAMHGGGGLETKRTRIGGAHINKLPRWLSTYYQ